MFINAEINAYTRDFIKYALLLTPAEYASVRKNIEPTALHNLRHSPKAKVAFVRILNIVGNAVNSMGGGTL